MPIELQLHFRKWLNNFLDKVIQNGRKKIKQALDKTKKWYKNPQSKYKTIVLFPWSIVYHIYITTSFKLWLFILYGYMKQHFRALFPQQIQARNLARWFSESLFPLWSRHSLLVWSHRVCTAGIWVPCCRKWVTHSLWLQWWLLTSCEKMSGKGKTHKERRIQKKRQTVVGGKCTNRQWSLSH